MPESDVEVGALRLHEGGLYAGDAVLLSGLGGAVTLRPDPHGVGAFLHFQAAEPLSRHVFASGRLESAVRFTACHRYEPFWMKAVAGVRAGEVPVETQFLLVELASGDCVLFAPLVDGAFRAALQGTGEDGLELVAESGDPAVVTDALVGLFVATGSNPYALMEAGAVSVQAQIGVGRLRREKPLPDFMDQFGWCTWDAFYQDVSQEKVREGLESFARGGVTPKVLILDDGWQSQHRMPTGEQRLTAFAANEKFPGDLAPTVTMAKQDFGVETFLVWHALHGYWAGVDGDALPGYGVRALARNYSPGILHHVPEFNVKYWGAIVGVVPPEHVYRFYQDYHRHLRRQGVDGVKVDNQGAVEGAAYGMGGRVTVMQQYHEALEGSVHTHFRGNLINCMSCASEMLYGALNSNLTRTSTDFWPNRPESHGQHLYVNAQVSAWFGEFVQPDWDMFQSGHVMGPYHAAGRAAGGCPVYVSDKPDAHNFDVLRKLVLPEGSILRADLPGRPTRDCLFHDPTREAVLLKIFNRNGAAGLLGVFHARTEADGGETPPINGTIGPADVEGLEGESFAVYAHHAQTLAVLGRAERAPVTLPFLACEVYTLVPIANGFAPIGLTEKFNSAGAILDHLDDGDAHEILVQSGGPFLAWSETRPSLIYVNDAPVEFAFDAETHKLEFTVPGDDPGEIWIEF